MRTRPSEWAVYVVFEDGEKRYVGAGPEGWTVRYVRSRGSAKRYESEAAARHIAEEWDRNHPRIVERGVEEIVNPRTTGT